MSPRPRKVSDDEIFAATYRAMQRLGPGELTLAEIGQEAGVTAAAIVQRFGSKRELLLALSAGAADSAGDFVAALDAKHRSPLAALLEYADCVARLAASPAALARNLAYLQIDLTDADFRRPLLVQAKATRAGLASLLRRAVSSRELTRNTDTRALARTVEATLNGSMLTWAFYRDGTAAHWMRTDLEAVLAPWRVKRRRADIR